MTASLLPAKKAKLSSNAIISSDAGLEAGLDHVAAHLLFTISRVWPIADAQFNGQPFIANTMAWWQAKAKLSPKVCKARMTVLRRMGFIRTERHKFHGEPMTFLQLSAAVVNGKLVALPPGHIAPGRTVKVSAGTVHSGPKGTEHSVPHETELKKQEVLTGSSTGKELPVASAQALSSSPAYLVSSQGEIEPMVSVADFAKLAEATKKAASKKNKNLLVDASEDVKPAKLHHLWAQCMGEIGQHVGPMVGEEGGKLKQFIAKCPPGTAKVLVALAVHEWDLFASVLRSKYGVYKVSDTPQIGIVLKHADALVTWWLKREKDKAAQEAVQAAKAVPAPTPTPQDAEPAQPQKSGHSAKVKDPATDPSSHLFKFNFAIEQFGLEYAKAWSMKKHGVEFPPGFAIDCTETNQ